MDQKQIEITLQPRPKGFHIITSDILAAIDISSYDMGIAHIYIKHTSASLAINESADPTVRADFNNFFEKIVPDNEPYFQHTIEGPDDMPAHIKSSIIGTSVTIPITGGALNLGTWQGIYLCEHRDYGGARKIVITIQATKQ